MWRAIYFILVGCRLLRGALGDPQMGNRPMTSPAYGPMVGPPMYGPEMGGPPMDGPEMGGPPMYGPEMGRPPMDGPEMGSPPISGPVYGPKMGSPMGPLRNVPKNPADTIDSLEDDLSPGAFFKIKENQEGPVGLGFGLGESAQGPSPSGPAGPLGYEHFDLATLQAMARQQQELKENYALLQKLEFDNDAYKKEELLIYNLCFSVSYMWRRGRQSIRKYFHLRDIYVNHMPFEVGYMTHAIMVKYQSILELYEYCNNLIRASTPRTGQKISQVHMTHFYTSIQEDARSIIHFCNMLHELRTKFRSRPYDPANRFDIPPNSTEVNDTDSEEEHGGRLRADYEKKKFTKIDKSYLAKRIEQSHKLIDQALAQRKKKLQAAREYYQKHPYMASSKRTQQTMRLWSPNLDYGWSGEEEDW